jgi:transmembrane sensor
MGVVPRRSMRWAGWWFAAAAASIAATVGVAHYSPFRPEPVQQARYDAPLGKRKVVNLSDGSRIELNTQSIVRTAIDAKSRDVWLDSGEAYFEVARRDGRTFVVHAGSQTITVLGTKFAVRRDMGRVMVNVVEGKVRVEDNRRGDASAAIVTAGDTVISRAGSTLIAPKSSNRVERALAWRDGILTFDLMPLSEVAAEFNRYNRLQLSVDSKAAAIPIGGAFQASNVEAFTRLLHDAYGLKVERTGDRVKIFY